MNFNTFINEGKFDHIADLVKSLHFEIDPKNAEEKKIELGKKQGEVSKRKQIESAEYSLRRFRKSINFGDGTYLGVFIPGSYDAATSTLGDGPHKKAVKKIKWNQKKYSQWLEDMASNGGAENAFDMAQNAKNEPGLIDWVKKNFRDDDPLQRIQWDIEGFAESVEEAKLSVIHKAAKKGSYPVSLVVIENGKVVKQELVETPQIVPAAFNQLKKEYPNAIVHVESKTGERLFTEAKEDFEPHMMYDPETGKGYKAEKQEDHDRMDKLGYVHEKPEINEAENYLTGEFKVGDKIKTNFGEWEVIEIDYKPGKSFIAPFIFKGKDLKRVNIPNPPKTNKNAVGYKVTDGAKYPTIGFLYQYKDITKLATVGVDESVVTEGTYDSKDHIGNTTDGQGSSADIYKKGKGYYVVVSGEHDYDFEAKNDKELINKLEADEFDSSDILESVEEAKMSKEKIESLIWSLENEKDSWHPSSASKKKSMLDKLKKDLSKFESVVTEAKAYKLKASEFGGDTFSAAYNVKGEPTWRVHSTYAIDQVSGENNPDERDVVFFEAMPINNEIIIKIGGINNLKRTGATVGNNFGATIEEWKNDPEGIAKEASEFLTDATHLKWINKKARSQGQVIKWALKDDYSSVIIDLVNKALGLKESVNEEKIKYDKGSTYQSSGHWTVVVDSNSSGLDIRVNHSAGWRLDPHDEKEETFELLDNGRQRATLYFKSGNIDKFAKLMFDLNDRTTHGNATKLTAKDYADIIRVWIDMRKANESVSESYTINDIYNLIVRHRFDNDYKKLSAKDKKWVENDAEERGFNESFTNLEFEMIYTSLLEKLSESSEKEIKQNDMKHVKLFEQFINEASVYFRSLSPEVQELLIAYYYAVEDTPEGDKFSEKIIELGLSDSNICPDFDVNNFSGGLIKFRGDKRKAIEHLANFTDLGKVKVPTGDYPTATRFIMDMITQNTGKKVRLEYKGSFGKSPADLIEYDPEVVSQPSANTIHPHESDVVLIKNFNRSKIRKVLDICIKEGWIKKPVYNW